MSKTDSSASGQGFASMDPEKQHEIASKGGQVRGQQLHEQAEKRRELEAEGRHDEAEEVKPKVGFAAMDPEKQVCYRYSKMIALKL
jgi:general stress protein YciG